MKNCLAVFTLTWNFYLRFIKLFIRTQWKFTLFNPMPLTKKNIAQNHIYDFSWNIKEVVIDFRNSFQLLCRDIWRFQHKVTVCFIVSINQSVTCDSTKYTARRLKRK